MILGAQCLFFMCWGTMFILIMALTVASLAMWVWMLIDVIKRPDEAFPNPGENTKAVWLVVIALTGAVGAIVYYVAVYRAVGPAPTT